MPQTNVRISTQYDNTGAGAAAVALGKVGATASKAERDLATYAQTVARSQRAQGDATGAIATYEHALSRLNRTSQQAITIEAQLAATRKSAQGLTLPRSVESFGAEALTQLKTGLIGIVGPAAAAQAALQAIPAAIDLAKLGAQADLVRTRFDSLAQTAGMAGDELLAALRTGSGGEISDLNLQLAANKAQLLGVADSAEEFGVLMSIARDRAQQMGITTTQAFDDLVTGLGRGSRLILDNLGILVNADAANAAYAASIGKTVTALTDQERKQALINQVIKDGQTTLAATGGAVESAASAQARLGASIDNIKAKLGSLIANGTAPTVNSLSDLISSFDGMGISSGEGAVAAMNLVRAITGLPPVTAASQKAQEDWTQSIFDWIEARKVQIGLAQAPVVSDGGGGNFEFFTAKIIEGGGAFNAYAQAANAAGIASQEAAGRINFAQQAIDASARASIVATAQQQAQAAATDLLTQETNAAVTAFLNMNPNIDAAGIASQVAAGKIPTLIGELANLRIGVDQTTAAMALLAAQQAGIAGVSKLFETGANNPTGAGAGLGRLGGGASGQLADQQALVDAQFENQLKRAKDNAAKIALLQGKLNSTKDPLARARIEGQIVDLQNQKDTSAKSHTAELNKQLTIQESIYDSINKQRQAALDLAEQQIEGNRLTRKENRQNQILESRLARGGLTPEREAQIREQIALNTIHQQQRALKQEQTAATAGAAITDKGKLLQSAPGGGAVPIGPQTTPAGIAPFQGAAAPFSSVTPPPVVTVNISIVDGKLTNADAGGGTLNIFLNSQRQALNSGGA